MKENMEQNMLVVSYEADNQKIVMDAEFVKKYLVRGKEEYTTPQELMMFLQTCRARKLNPLINGEVFLIKYAKDSPAQIVVGKAAYLKRAFENPAYLYKEDGIIVQNKDNINIKQGCCLYPGEKLVGGWCKVFYMKQNVKCFEYREVSLAEYNQNQSSWKSKPATMINKVAVSQCIREAFPSDFGGLYADDELTASGAIPVEYSEKSEKKEDRITSSERKNIFEVAKEYFADKAEVIVKDLLSGVDLDSTKNMTKEQYKTIMNKMKEIKDEFFTEKPPEKIEEIEEEPIKEIEVEESI